jgi:hypothetical protein
MRRPINATTGLHLANSMIKGTKIERQLTKWKLKHVVQTRQQCTSTTDDPSTMLLDGDESPTLLGRSVVTMDDEETTGREYKKKHHRWRRRSKRLAANCYGRCQHLAW